MVSGSESTSFIICQFDKARGNVQLQVDPVTTAVQNTTQNLIKKFLKYANLKKGMNTQTLLKHLGLTLSVQKLFLHQPRNQCLFVETTVMHKLSCLLQRRITALQLKRWLGIIFQNAKPSTRSTPRPCLRKTNKASKNK